MPLIYRSKKYINKTAKIGMGKGSYKALGIITEKLNVFQAQGINNLLNLKY